jgi:hypothetical protein
MARAVGDVRAHVGEGRMVGNPCEPGLLEIDVVVVVEIVDADDRVAPVQQAKGQRVANESGGAGDENLHGVILVIVLMV